MFLALLLLAQAVSPSESIDPLELDFAHGIAPQLMERGCSAAECHGGATGRGGLRLSLFGTDPRADWSAIAAEHRGRRIDAAAPDQSLLLRKPSRRLPHGGGRRLPSDGAAYASLRHWIEAGTPYVGPLGALEVEAFELERRGDQLIANASFVTESGERFQQDVSDRCLFDSTDDRVVEVGRDGTIVEVGDGAAWLLARYGRWSARWPVFRRDGQAMPQPRDDVDADAAQRWAGRLELLGIRPAPRANDHELCRRLHLVLLGRPPRPDEVDAWRQRPEPHRVKRTIDQLLSGEEWVDPWSRRLRGLLEVPEPHEDADHQRTARNALRAALDNVVATDSILAYFTEALADPTGHGLLRRLPDPRDRSEFVARAMLGVRLGCARCHDHPDDRWTQSEHLGFSACFADAPRGRQGMAVGRLFHPANGRPVEPALLPIGEHGGADSLVAWLEGPARRDAARHFANWVFAEVMGRGIVHPVGDHRLSNPALHEPTLEHLAAVVSEEGFSLKATLRAVLRGPWFTRSSAPRLADGTPDADFDARVESLAAFGARALSGDALRGAVAAVLATSESNVVPPKSPFALALHLQNGPLVRAALAAPGNEVQTLIDFVPEPERRLQELFIMILARPPRAAERAAFLPALGTSDGVLELATALLCSREFGSLR